MYLNIQGLNIIIGTLVKFKDSLFNIELVLLQPSVKLQFVQEWNHTASLLHPEDFSAIPPLKPAPALSVTTEEGNGF